MAIRETTTVKVKLEISCDDDECGSRSTYECVEGEGLHARGKAERDGWWFRDRSNVALCPDCAPYDPVEVRGSVEKGDDNDMYSVSCPECGWAKGEYKKISSARRGIARHMSVHLPDWLRS